MANNEVFSNMLLRDIHAETQIIFELIFTSKETAETNAPPAF